MRGTFGKALPLSAVCSWPIVYQVRFNMNAIEAKSDIVFLQVSGGLEGKRMKRHDFTHPPRGFTNNT